MKVSDNALEWKVNSLKETVNRTRESYEDSLAKLQKANDEIDALNTSLNRAHIRIDSLSQETKRVQSRVASVEQYIRQGRVVEPTSEGFPGSSSSMVFCLFIHPDTTI